MHDDTWTHGRSRSLLDEAVDLLKLFLYQWYGTTNTNDNNSVNDMIEIIDDMMIPRRRARMIQ